MAIGAVPDSFTAKPLRKLGMGVSKYTVSF